jgi:CDP-glucose 4,6-dehydratase
MQASRYHWAGKKVLVTGASGFKGSWLSQALLELGARVYGTTRKLVHPLSAYSLFELGKQLVAVDADISDQQQVFDMLLDF